MSYHDKTQKANCALGSVSHFNVDDKTANYKAEIYQKALFHAKNNVNISLGRVSYNDNLEHIAQGFKESKDRRSACGISDMTPDLDFCKKALIQVNEQLSYLQALKNSRMVRDSLLSRKISISTREYKRNPLAIFPEELWAISFDHLNDFNDIKSCYNSCQLFRTMLKNTICTWMFPQAYLFVSSYLNQSDINTCRLICKTWNSVANKTDTRRAKFSFPLSQSTWARLEQLKVGNESCFSGFKIHIYLEYFPVYVKDQVFVEVKQFIREYCASVPFLSITSDVNYIDTLDVTNLIIYTISHCKQLSELHVYAEDVFPHDLEEITKEMVQSLLPANFKVPACLTKLILELQGSSDLLVVQSRILQDCQNQLEELTIDEWDSFLFENIHWPNLKKLKAHIKNSDDNWEFLNHLVEFDMPNLTTLSVTIGPACLKLLLQATHKFPKLEKLNIFASNFNGFSCQEMALVPTDLIVSSLTKLLDLNIIIKGALDLSFLLLFPSVETLRVTIFPTLFGTKKVSMKGNPEIIRVSDLKNRRRVRASDLWKLLPCLKKLEVDQPYSTGLATYRRST